MCDNKNLIYVYYNVMVDFSFATQWAAVRTYRSPKFIVIMWGRFFLDVSVKHFYKNQFLLIKEPPQRLCTSPPSSYRNSTIHGNSNKSVLFPLESFCSKISPQWASGNRFKFGCEEASSGKSFRLLISASASVDGFVGDIVGRVFLVGSSAGVSVSSVVKIASSQHTFGVV